MESIEEILTCQVCMERFNDTDKKPLFVSCGHTFCSKCLRFIYRKPNLKCPLDKKESKYESFNIVPTNYSVLGCLNTYLQSQGETKLEKKCEKHPSDSLKFYCQTDAQLICQTCLLESHLGPSHQVVSSDNYLIGDILKSELQKCLARLEEKRSQTTQMSYSIQAKIQSHIEIMA